MAEVEYQVRRLADFYLPLPYVDYWHVGGGVWKSENKQTEQEQEERTGFKSPDDMIAGMVTGLLGEESGVEEIDGGGPELRVTVNLDECDYAAEQLAHLFGLIVDHFVREEPVKAEGEPYSYNRSGNENYYDPTTIYPAFRPPEAAVLARQGMKKRRRRT